MRADEVVAVVGLGYVGLPLAVEFGKMEGEKISLQEIGTIPLLLPYPI